MTKNAIFCVHSRKCLFKSIGNPYLKGEAKMHICKKALTLIFSLLLSVIILSFTCAASENIGYPIGLNINGTPVEGAVLINNSIAYAPYRAIVGAIDPDAEFEWNDQIKASITRGNGIEIIAYTKNVHTNSFIEANGRVIYIYDFGNMNIEGTLYVPIRSIATAYSLNCSWDSVNQVAVLSGTPAPIMSADQFYNENDVYWLSRIISAESRGEPFVGQIAVGNVVLKRVEDGSFPGNIYDVIFDRRFGIQFTPAYSGAIYRNPNESCILAAKIALEGVEVVDALYFCTRKVSAGSWMQRNCRYVTTIGDHVFYY